MSSVKPLTQEWMDLILSKPSISADLASRLEKVRMAKADEMKYVFPGFLSLRYHRLKIELDSREKESESLKEQLGTIQAKFRNVHQRRVSLEEELKNLISESHRIEAESWAVLKDAGTKAVTGLGSSPSHGRGSAHDRIVPVFSDPEKIAEADSLRKLHHVVATIISRNSSRLSSMMSDRCDSEMDRTRRIDNLLQTEQCMLDKELEQIREVAKYVKQSAELRRQYDGQAAEDFRDLVELALAADSLERDLKSTGKPSRKSKLLKEHSSNGSRISDLQARVCSLRQQVEEAQGAYAAESKQLQSDLVSMKVQKRNMKTKFQADIKSIFADLGFLGGRIDRTESSLEKANIHYQLDEEEIVNIVSPIIEGIDGLRDKLEAISRDAEEIFYGN